MRFYIVTDSASDIPVSLIDKWGISVCRLTAHFNGRSYEDSYDEVPMHEFFESLKNGASSSTSQVNANQFEEVFREKLKDHDKILYIGFSQVLSGTYQSATIAKQTMTDEDPSFNDRIILIDSKSASLGVALLIQDAVEMRDAGKTADETAEFIENEKLKVNHWFTVDDLNHLKRGGRVSSLQATVGSILGIKPILYTNDEGKLVNVGKAKGRKKAITTLYEMFKQKSHPGIKRITISHGDCEADAITLRDMIMKDSDVVECIISPIGMVIGSHAGPGTLALFFKGENRENFKL